MPQSPDALKARDRLSRSIRPSATEAISEPTGSEIASDSGVVAFSSREPASTSLENRSDALDHMFLRGVEIYGRHGVHDWERRDGQMFVVDVDWWLDNCVAASEDRLEAGVCYQRLHDRVVEIVAGSPRALIETLARLLVDDLLTCFAQIVEIKVAVHKPQAAIGGVFSDVGVEVTRRRAEGGSQ